MKGTYNQSTTMYKIEEKKNKKQKQAENLLKTISSDVSEISSDYLKRKQATHIIFIWQLQKKIVAINSHLPKFY